jgi:hypothetical protein
MKYDVTSMGEIGPCYPGLRGQLLIDCSVNLRGMRTPFGGAESWTMSWVAGDAEVLSGGGGWDLGLGLGFFQRESDAA